MKHGAVLSQGRGARVGNLGTVAPWYAGVPYTASKDAVTATPTRRGRGSLLFSGPIGGVQG
jgi:hypothetical protein